MIIRHVRSFLTLLIALILITGTAFAGGDQEAGDGAQAATSGEPELYGTIEYLEGEVTVNGDTAQIGGELQTGDRIATGPDARAEILFNDENLFRLGSETVLTITFGENRIREADLEQGTFAAVFDKLRQVGEGQDSFRIRTPTAVGGVRGTTFFVQVEEPSSTYICTCNGKTHLTPFGADDGYSVEATHHTAYRFVQAEDTVERQDSSMMYHNDTVMDGIAEKIGVTIPWGE